MKSGLMSKFFANTREILNRSFDRDKQNTPARVADGISPQRDGGCQCVSCFTSCHTCNK